MPIETERKFLIERPDLAFLTSQEDCAVLEITQTYLTQPAGAPERRVRRILENGRETFVFTQKERITAVSRIENEREITPAEYAGFLTEAYSQLTKTRYRFPFGGHLIEIDVYPCEIGGDALEGLAVLEVELASEEEEIRLPDWITVLRELTGTPEFSNKTLARRL